VPDSRAGRRGYEEKRSAAKEDKPLDRKIVSTKRAGAIASALLLLQRRLVLRTVLLYRGLPG
jgi:hypothetical protein